MFSTHIDKCKAVATESENAVTIRRRGKHTFDHILLFPFVSAFLLFVFSFFSSSLA